MWEVGSVKLDDEVRLEFSARGGSVFGMKILEFRILPVILVIPLVPMILYIYA
jgi:hypothetical protein